jgi:hypothetical protein
MAYITLLALIAGLLMWLLSGNGTVKEVGKIMFMAACFGICIAAAPATVHLLQR